MRHVIFFILFRPEIAIRAIIFIFLLPLASTTLAASPGPAPLILGVHPYLPHDEIVARFTPLANYLSRSLGQPVTVRVGRNYEEHIEAIGTDSIDIAYMGPVPYVKLTETFGKKPLLARQVINNDPYLRGEIIARRDSTIRALSDLKGKCFVLGDPNSTMSSVLPKIMLEQSGVRMTDLARTLVMEGHKNVALTVLAGDCDAGAVKREVYQEFAAKGLRVVAELPLVSDHLFVASSKLPPSLIQKLRQAFLKLNRLPEGKAIMASIHPQMTALVAPKDSDYDNLRALFNSKASSSKR